MGFFDFLHGADINEGVELFRSTPGALLLDVRTAQEYAGGHIPGSVNIPLQELERAKSVIPTKDTPVFVHCLSGARSRQAAAELKHMGYSNVQNIGGISAWRGEVQK